MMSGDSYWASKSRKHYGRNDRGDGNLSRLKYSGTFKLDGAVVHTLTDVRQEIVLWENCSDCENTQRVHWKMSANLESTTT